MPPHPLLEEMTRRAHRLAVGRGIYFDGDDGWEHAFYDDTITCAVNRRSQSISISMRLDATGHRYVVYNEGMLFPVHGEANYERVVNYQRQLMLLEDLASV